ncbi:MAG TPA: DUF4912 domain-containing protein [Pyrinomonadaceae bacterium]|nr:DUF4912 domain-containing protein [Pyrinomonadaceae bacterium]
MNEQNLETTDIKTSSETETEFSTVEKPIEKKFSLDDFKIDSTVDVSSPTRKPIVELETQDAKVVLVETEPELEQSEVFKELSEPKLPELGRENRARLQMQSPTKIYFYWRVKTNPFQTLNRVFGNQTNYTLVAKLVNQITEREELFPVEAEGSTWFDVDADSTYRAEIGFYATNRPFVRVMFSNVLETPRKNPSPRRDYSENFSVSANQFAEVLDVSGFQQDAFEVALAGDDVEFADNATQAAFSQIISVPRKDFDTNKSSEIRFVLLALASGYTLENLREHISPSLFTVLQGNAENLSAEKALSALQKNFGVSADETVEEETFAPTVFGASLINFPRISKRKALPKFSPISSFRF